MNRMPLYGAAVLAALVPAAVGLWGNGSFSHAVPVNVPASAQIASVDNHPRSTPTPSPSPSPKATRAVEAGDDHGGDTPRDQRTEPGDDRRDATSGSDDVAPGAPASGNRASGSDDRRSGTSGSGSSGSSGGHDDGPGHDAGDDHGGRGSGGHGSDD